MSTKIAELYARITADTTGLQAGLNNTKAGISGLKGGLSALGLSGMASFISVTGAITGTIAAIKQIYNSTLEYGDAIREISMLNGVSTEEASRLLQVTDDYKVSVQDLTLASRTLAKEGISLTTNSLAQLSDEYNNLGTASEKEAFLLKNFGARGGTAFVELMQQGGQAIRDQSNAVADNLVLSQRQLDLQRENEIQMDAVNDALRGLNDSLGEMLMGSGASLLGWLASSIAGWGMFADTIPLIARRILEMIDPELQFKDSLIDANGALADQEMRLLAARDAAWAYAGALSSVIGWEHMLGFGGPGMNNAQQLEYLRQTQPWGYGSSTPSSTNPYWIPDPNNPGHYMVNPNGPGGANGMNFIVPSGYPNDSFPMRVQSGEHVQVTPAAQVQSGQSEGIDMYILARMIAKAIGQESDKRGGL
jgi:hypothetical protein